MMQARLRGRVLLPAMGVEGLSGLQVGLISASCVFLLEPREVLMEHQQNTINQVEPH